MKMEDKKYNGWTNYETWVVNLWMDNDENSYKFWLSEGKRCLDKTEPNDSFTLRESARYELQLSMRDYFEVNNPLEENSSVYTDLLRAALSEVNWNEIAASWIDRTLEDVSYTKKEK